jgi:hypothetical protein
MFASVFLNSDFDLLVLYEAHTKCQEAVNDSYYLGSSR